MKQPSPTYSAISDMENDVHSVVRLARLLGHVASSPNMIEAECLYALADPLMEIGKTLMAKFEKAYDLAGGQS